ncbi:MFS transporter [Thermomonospora umbrina]|uniref:Sugar phosphate permease n=1 Tax=Thermomonospora umbrina TaxID=111806 RepID=A0A3D9SS88_9ACTN|nr:MFS transporter [Thermomonospora umbrina]REE97330.1 sugar phosphate permease [Thermomonospora umbrina]
MTPEPPAGPDTDAADADPPGGWPIVAALAISQTVGYGVLYYAFAVVLPAMRRDLNTGTAQITVALTLGLLVSAVAAVPVGRRLDAHGGRALMTVGSVLATVGVAAWASVQNLWQLYAVFVLLGLASAMVLYEAAFAVVVAWFRKGRATALLAVTIIAGFASTIFMPLTGRLTDAYGWRTALLVLAVVHGAVTVPLHLLVRRPPAVAAAARERTEEADAGSAAERDALARAALRDPLFWTLGAAFFAQGAAVAVIAVHLVTYLTELGHRAAFAATVAGLIGALSVSGRLVITVAARRTVTAVATAVVFALQAAAALVLLAVGRTGAGAIGCVLVFGLGFGVATIARPALLADAYGTTAYATISGLLALPLIVAKATMPLAAAAVRNVTGTYTPVVVATSVCCAVGAVGLLTAHRLLGARLT